MKSAADVRSEAQRACERNLHRWVVSAVRGNADAGWPRSLSLGQPSEVEAEDGWQRVVDWAREWQSHSGPGLVEFTTRRWRSHGHQSLPKRLTFASANELADFAAELHPVRLSSGVERLGELAATWPSLLALSPRHLSLMIDLTDTDFDSLRAVLHWLDANRARDIFPRAMSIPGVDTKWYERNRSVCDGLWSCRVDAGDAAPVELRQSPDNVQGKVLDPQLRVIVGGMGEFAASIETWAAVPWHPQVVVVCENKQTGLSFDDMPGTVVLLGRGYAIERFDELGWLRSARVLYWGDIDTHGFAILSRLRSHVSHVESVLMDQPTLLAHASQWVQESTPTTAPLEHLTATEFATYRGLVDGAWGERVRLEQERVLWSYAMDRFDEIQSVMAGWPRSTIELEG